MLNFGSKSFGLEELSNEVAIILHDNLNDKITEINSIWAAKDQEYAIKMGKTFTACNLESIDAWKIDVGEPKPLTDEFYEMEERFPSVNIIATSSKDTGTGGDHYTNYEVPLNIECWVSATPEEGPSFAFKRASRIIDAVNACLVDNPSLNGSVLKLTKSPQSAISPIITKDLITPNVNLDNTFYKNQQDKFNGYYLCGGAIIYTIKKNSSF